MNEKLQGTKTFKQYYKFIKQAKEKRKNNITHNVVYKINCIKANCKKCYVGQTKRAL